jgi:hypothetical protein
MRAPQPGDPFRWNFFWDEKQGRFYTKHLAAWTAEGGWLCAGIDWQR